MAFRRIIFTGDKISGLKENVLNFFELDKFKNDFPSVKSTVKDGAKPNVLVVDVNGDGADSVSKKLKDIGNKWKVETKIRNEIKLSPIKESTKTKLIKEENNSINSSQKASNEDIESIRKKLEKFKEKFPNWKFNVTKINGDEYFDNTISFSSTNSTDDEVEKIKKLMDKIFPSTLKEDQTEDVGDDFDFIRKNFPKASIEGPKYANREGQYVLNILGSKDSNPKQMIIFKPEGDKFLVQCIQGYGLKPNRAAAFGFVYPSQTGYAGVDRYLKDGNYNPVVMDKQRFLGVCHLVNDGFSSEAKSQGDFYRNRGNTSGTIDEGTTQQYKPGDLYKEGKQIYKILPTPEKYKKQFGAGTLNIWVRDLTNFTGEHFIPQSSLRNYKLMKDGNTLDESKTIKSSELKQLIKEELTQILKTTNK